jgi:hypothetical protein
MPSEGGTLTGEVIEAGSRRSSMRRTTLLPSLLALAVALAVISAVAPPLAAQEATPTTHDPAAMHAAFAEAIQVNDA